MKRLIPIAVITAAAVALLVITSAGNSKTGASYSAAANAPAAKGATSSIATRTNALGKYLVDSKGRTLYLFEADKANMSACSGPCLSIWPGFSSGGKPPVVKDGALASKLGVTTAGHGKQLVTYNGHPLYYYVGDQKPGDTKGQGLDQFGGGWYVVTPAGSKIDEG